MSNREDFNHSYWEKKTYFSKYDLIVIGSGIVGISSAISFRKKNKKAKILIIERGILPAGASTKNAGFASCGSAGELLDDLKKTSESTVLETVEMRWKGLRILRNRLGDKNMNYRPIGGYELFRDPEQYENTLSEIEQLNIKMNRIISRKDCFTNVSKKTTFKKVKGILLNKYEGQIDTGLMMRNLQLYAIKNNIFVLNNINIFKVKDVGHGVELQSNYGLFVASRVLVATNGFAKELLDINDVKPARAQVLITKPISGLKIKGCYHYDRGYYYFRDIDNRILLGGGRNLDFETETTTDSSTNTTIQNKLDQLLKEVILPGQKFEIDGRWTGIMGVGSEKKPIIKFVSKNVLAAVRMGGMGIAIGSWVGEKAASLISGE